MTRSSAYMEWAKTRSQARFNLATSGLAHFPMADLPVKIEDLELSGPSYYGYPPLQQALAAHCGVPEECLVAANGTSMANYLAMAAILDPGDEVLIEHPTYELLVDAARYIGANVKRFNRRFALDPSEVERAIGPRTRLVVLSNLHNPSSTFTNEAALCQVGEIARRAGALVLVDEVYLDAAFTLAPRSAFHLGEPFVVTSSLTKVYGLSGLRCGWVLAPPELAKKMWRLNDLFGVIPAHAAERLSILSLAHLDTIRARARRLLDANRDVLNRFLESRPDLEVSKHEFGTVSFPRLRKGSVEQFCALLREKYETSVVPGSFFEMPDHFRIGIGGDTGPLATGLERLGAALDDL